MPKDLIKAIARRYAILIVFLVAVFVVMIALQGVNPSMFVNIIATLLLVALVPFAIIILAKKKIK